EAYRGAAGEGGDFFILGSIGPTGIAVEDRASLRAAYLPQFEALLSEGVDALLFETFSSLSQLLQLLGILAEEFPDRPPVIAGMALHRCAGLGGWNHAPASFIEQAFSAGADVAGINCCAPWEAIAFAGEAARLAPVREGKLLLSAMPNAGGFQRIGNRYMTTVNAEYMGRVARSLAEMGVRLVGGCCEVHPSHIREMHNFLHGHMAGAAGVTVESTAALEPAGDGQKSGNGPFSRKLKQGAFAVSVEILPSRGTSPEVLARKIAFISRLAQSGRADAVDVTDGSRGIPLMPPGDFINAVRSALGWSRDRTDSVEFIPHFTTRDLNIMGLQSRLIGLHILGIHNVLFITGDPPKMSPAYPRSTAVFDVDSVGMIRFTHSALNAGVDFGGRPLARDCDPRTHFTIGSGFEPEALDLKQESEKLRRKIDAGADYIMTQPVFRPEPMKLLDPFRGRIPIVAGVMVLTGLAHARRVNEVPGVVIPGWLFRRLEEFDDPADQARAAAEIAAEQVRWVRREGWSGLYLMSPASLEPITDVLAEGLG
ncbi:MAG: hypothetical protein FJW35_04595, partial [Acidobacteria bacterium]|nr:hypothetical protein [Acidobacteriota bacterium]